MRAVDQWAAIHEELSGDWAEAQLAFTPEGEVSEAAAILAPLAPGRVGDELRIHVARAESGAERVRNVLGRLDARRVWGTLALLNATREEAAAPTGRASAETRWLAAAWEDVQAELPPDWSNILCQLDLDSSDHVPRAALLGAPLNPARVPGTIAIRFRASGRSGYGASPGMVRRCLERMDADGITGRLSVVFGISDVDNAVTQGPVWRIAGRSV
jgi:hypothetical protein